MIWKGEMNRRLLRAILAIETKSEAESFLRDLMTEAEIKEFAKRLRAAEMLIEKIPYVTIAHETGLSSTTIARVAKWLNGKSGGYKTIISRLHHHHPARARRGLA